MFLRDGKHQEGQSHGLDFYLMTLLPLVLIILVLSEQEHLGFQGRFEHVATLGDVLDVFHYEVHRHVVGSAWDDQVSVTDGGVNEVTEGVLYEFVILGQNTIDCSPAFGRIS
jgi:hypothetical protein